MNRQRDEPNSGFVGPYSSQGLHISPGLQRISGVPEDDVCKWFIGYTQEWERLMGLIPRTSLRCFCSAVCVGRKDRERVAGPSAKMIV